MFFNRFAKREAPFPLVVGMSGVKLGDRVVQVGCAHGGHLAAIGAKVGLSGRAVAVVRDEASGALAEKAAAKAGVLVEVERTSGATMPFDADSFDLGIIDDTGGAFAALPAAERAATIRELARIVRPGGRAMIIGSAAREGLGSLLSFGSNGGPLTDPAQAMTSLDADGFRGARILAEREGLVFVEAIRPRDAGVVTART